MGVRSSIPGGSENGRTVGQIRGTDTWHRYGTGTSKHKDKTCSARRNHYLCKNKSKQNLREKDVKLLICAMLENFLRQIISVLIRQQLYLCK